MIDKIKKYINISMLASLFLAIIGVLIMVYPSMSIKVFTYFIATLITIIGICLIVEEFRLGKFSIIFDFSILGILLLTIGIIIFVYPNGFMNLIPILVGISFILNGFMNTKLSILMKGTSSWILSVIISILSIICGILFVLDPTFSKELLTIYAGIIILIYSIFNFIDMILIKKNIKKIEKSLKKNITILID